MYDVVVVGAGPAGLAAAAYTLQHHHTTVVIAPDMGGKAAYRLQLPWLSGRQQIIGEEVVEAFRTRLIEHPKGKQYLDRVHEIVVRNDTFHVITDDGGTFIAPVMIVATGVTAQRLGVPGEDRLSGYGLTYSAPSHVPLFAERRAVVVGSTLRALHAASELATIASHVTFVVPEPVDLAGFAVGRHLLNNQRVEVLNGTRVIEVLGETYVSGVRLSMPDGTQRVVDTDGVFVELGLVSNTHFLGDLVRRTAGGKILVDDRCATSFNGIFAAGDITSLPNSEQVLIALGEGARAGLSACAYLAER